MHDRTQPLAGNRARARWFAVLIVTLAPWGCTSGERPEPDPWADARARGVDYRALGQEPGWILEIDHASTLRLMYDYGEREVTAAAPAPVVDGASTTYIISSPEAVSVRIERRACSDVMSGMPFPDTVTVTLAGRQLEGCGQRLD